jgi:sucrose-6-phosphate hydrolase SacC (GH32 family)
LRQPQGAAIASGGKLRLRLLLDRGSIEIFGAGGRVTGSQREQPEYGSCALEITSQRCPPRIERPEVYEVHSSW